LYSTGNVDGSNDIMNWRVECKNGGTEVLLKLTPIVSENEGGDLSSRIVDVLLRKYSYLWPTVPT
jgi:hypothetical protein